MKKVFLTGATGFIGSYIARQLCQAQYEVYSVKRDSSRLDLLGKFKNQIHWLDFDLFDLADLSDHLAEVDGVIHCAGMHSIEKSNSKEMFELNVQLTRSLINLSLSNGIKKFIHISSIDAIGKTKQISHIDENTKWVESELNSEYAYSKMLGEQEVWRGYVEGLSTIILNPGVVLGAGFWDKGSSGIIKKIERNGHSYPKGTNGFVDVRDVAQLAVKALESEISGERFIVVSENLKYKNLFEKIRKGLSMPAPIRPIEGIFLKLALVFDKLRSLVTREPINISKKSLALLSHDFHYNNQKSKISFDHKYIPIDRALELLIKYYIESKVKSHTFGIYPFQMSS